VWPERPEQSSPGATPWSTRHKRTRALKGRNNHLRLQADDSKPSVLLRAFMNPISRPFLHTFHRSHSFSDIVSAAAIYLIEQCAKRIEPASRTPLPRNLEICP
jgi:hypothetical protein